MCFPVTIDDEDVDIMKYDDNRNSLDDELSGLMIQTHERFLAVSSRIAALGRASDIHLVMATSRSAQNVIPAELKANIPTRLAFKVCCQVDSCTILDAYGAELLKGFGDAFFRDNTGELVHLQTPYINGKAVERVVAAAMRRDQF